MNTTEIPRLRPEVTRDSKPYWDGLKEGLLMIQQCADCGTYRHYPRPVCPQCYSMNVNWREASGKGTVHSWTVSHHAFHPSFKKSLPQIFVTADLEEGVRINAELIDGNADELAVGKPVRVSFITFDEELSGPALVLDET
jgi:uncharacterized OB-fold protein